MKDSPTCDRLTSGSATSETNERAYAQEKLISYWRWSMLLNATIEMRSERLSH